MDIQNDLSDQDLERLLESKIAAVDCEFGGLNPHRDQLYVVQLCDRNKTINVIKTSDWERAGNLKKLFLSQDVTKVFHFAVMDCAFILSHCKVVVAKPYCTKIASKLARTYTSSHSLNSLMEEFYGITKVKSIQTSFWGWAELSEEQKDYAVKDVIYSLGIKENLEKILSAKGNLPTGMSYSELNTLCQGFITTLVTLWMNGWDFGLEDPNSVFGK
jgi:ribonuclease D